MSTEIPDVERKACARIYDLLDRLDTATRDVFVLDAACIIHANAKAVCALHDKLSDELLMYETIFSVPSESKSASVHASHAQLKRAHLDQVCADDYVSPLADVDLSSLFSEPLSDSPTIIDIGTEQTLRKADVLGDFYECTACIVEWADECRQYVLTKAQAAPHAHNAAQSSLE